MKITKEQVEALIIHRTFTTLPSGYGIVCELTLRNGVEGHRVAGVAYVNTLADFDQEKGEAAAYAKALGEAWPYAAFLNRLERRTITHITVDGPVSPENLAQLVQQFQAAELDPKGGFVATPTGVKASVLDVTNNEGRFVAEMKEQQ